MKQYITKLQAAEYFAVSIRTISNWIRDGILPAYRIGSRYVRIDIDDLKFVIVPIPSVRRYR